MKDNCALKVFDALCMRMRLTLFDTSVDKGRIEKVKGLSAHS